MTGAHTSGPWFAEATTRNSGNPSGSKTLEWNIQSEDSVLVVGARGICRPTKKDGAANALIMAAAPSMLAALINSEFVLSIYEEENSELLIEVRDAIDRALGAQEPRP